MSNDTDLLYREHLYQRQQIVERMNDATMKLLLYCNADDAYGYKRYCNQIRRVQLLSSALHAHEFAESA
ncbi:MAG: hypothetical protein ACK54F_03550 [Planctomycetia bacterium]|jgi:hypothetical protein